MLHFNLHSITVQTPSNQGQMTVKRPSNEGIDKSSAVEPKTKTKHSYDVRRQVCGIKRAMHPQIQIQVFGTSEFRQLGQTGIMGKTNSAELHLVWLKLQ